MVVSYNPGHLFTNLVASLRPATAVFVVDNASTGGLDHLASAESLGATVIRLPDNQGVAGALQEGLERAEAEGYDFVLTFDQDSGVDAEFVESLITSAAWDGPRVAIVAPAVIDRHLDRYIQGKPTPSEPIADAIVITSGSMMRVSAVSEVGGLRRDLFIDQVDHDLCLRLLRAGHRVVVDSSVVLDHSVGAMRAHGVVRNSHHSADRQYYKYRNFVLILRDGALRTAPLWTLRVVIGLVLGPIKILAYDTDKATKLSAVGRGVIDGIRGRTGRRPVAPEPQRQLAIGPRALLICTPIFNYYEHISAALEARGFVVDYYDDRPSDNPFIKGAIRVRPSLIQRRIRAYWRDVLAKVSSNAYDVILVINGKTLPSSTLAELRSRNPRALSVLYLWDSVALYPHALELAPHVDRVASFDYADCDSYGLEPNPLFFTPPYGEVAHRFVAEPSIDVLTVCTAHANRYQTLKKTVPELEAAGLKVYSRMFLHPFRYAYDRLRTPEFTSARASEFIFRPVPIDEYVDLLADTRAVLDIAHSDQSGLTIRTVETVGAGRKLITTNARAAQEPFYDPSRILIIDGAAPDVAAITEFVTRTAQQPLADEIRMSYSLDCWLERLLRPMDDGR